MQKIGKKAGEAITADETLDEFDPGKYFNEYGEYSHAGLEAMKEEGARYSAALDVQVNLLEELLRFAHKVDMADAARAGLLEIYRGLCRTFLVTLNISTDRGATEDFLCANFEAFVAKRKARSSGYLRWANDPKKATMNEIEDEWWKRKDDGLRFTAVSFAREMAKKHEDAVTVEAIKNAQTRWNKEYRPPR